VARVTCVKHIELSSSSYIHMHLVQINFCLFYVCSTMQRADEYYKQAREINRKGVEQVPAVLFLVL